MNSILFSSQKRINGKKVTNCLFLLKTWELGFEWRFFLYLLSLFTTAKKTRKQTTPLVPYLTVQIDPRLCGPTNYLFIFSPRLRVCNFWPRGWAYIRAGAIFFKNLIFLRPYKRLASTWMHKFIYLFIIYYSLFFIIFPHPCGRSFCSRKSTIF
jgi:hypothetical protein